MKHPELTVSAIIFNPENKILLCKSHKWDNKYVIPGGHVEYGEKMEDALKREILEETGLTIYNNSHYMERHFIFMDYICKTDDFKVSLNDEAQEYSWVQLSDIGKYDLGGEVELLLNKVLNHCDKTDEVNIFYNYN